jgi:transcription termination factor Rho
MIVCVVTGGVASGKSFLCRHLATTCPYSVGFSSDEVVGRLLSEPSIVSVLTDRFGMGIVSENGELKKAALRELVFADAVARGELEGILHPLVFNALENDTNRARELGSKVLVAEVPLFYETQGTFKPDLVVLVATRSHLQLQRMVTERGLAVKAADDVIQAQWPLDRKLVLADVVIWNEGTPALLAMQADLLSKQLRDKMCIESLEGATGVSQSVATVSELTPPEVAAQSSDTDVVPLASDTADINASGPSSPEGKAEENGQPQSKSPKSDNPQPQPPFPDEISINDLQDRPIGSLQKLAMEVGWRANGSRTKHQLITELVGWMGQHGSRVIVEGFLEMNQESYGLIRYPKYSFAPMPEDIFVPIFVIKKFNLRPGQRIKTYVKIPREREKYLAMDRLVEIEGKPADEWQAPNPFDKLTATFPSERIILETPKEASVSARVVDLVAPLGKGQRALIVASPRSGKTMLLKEFARSIKTNHKEVHLIILLLDERPEEVTDFEDSVATEIYSSTFDEVAKRHAQVSELVLERAKRLVEMGQDVVVLLDSITRLARGYNAMAGGKGRTMSGGMDSKALMKPKKFFGAARKVEEGGSLTIVATALVDTESKADELIFEEFKGTGNMEISLDREISERRIFPAIHVMKSGTRRDDLLYHPDEFRRVGTIRKQLAAVPAAEGLENLIKNIQHTGTNAELLLKGLR